uniref:RNA cytidine acetyltransferase n=1 Tax=Ciona intestinalis TaxID=7719 RepID=UPI00089DB03D|nr:RNA cytidine acetyltransferase [Ciona intestinalis]|eukprot:XP_018667185.1 RNA cytidine acetyltransferase [Ciona intestinalis]
MRKKVDNRIRVLVENGVATKHRTMFFIVGDKCRNQVVILHHMLSKAQVRARPSVLWCYKKELGFSTHRKKKMKQIQKRISSGTLDLKENDPFELFVAATNVRYCYYNETHKILGSTYGMCVLQDFEALTPNLLARTIETVEGGGIICFLLRSMTSLKQLYTMTMDVHARYRTESHSDVVGRFNERFLLSVASCNNCLIIDDELNVLPVSTNSQNIEAVPPKPAEDSLTPSEKELVDLKESLQDTQPVGCVINCCKTIDQGKALLKFVDAISEKTLRSTVVMTAARGRGKSATLGLAISAAVAFGYSNIFVTSPSPENLKTLFEFVFKGFDALEYQEHLDYELIQSTNPDFNKAIVRVNVFREHRQTIQYIHPSDSAKLSQAELLVIDEAAAIPLPLVQSLLGPYLVFMSSTINGYEGTGRSLSLKLVKQLRIQSATRNTATTKQTTASPLGRNLSEITLEESVRYAPTDPIESWLNELLCLDCGSSSFSKISTGCPPPSACDLYYVNRDTLFCYHKASEAFLQRLMSLYVASHYKNTPNDLQMLSDAPAHHIFCLLPPVSAEQKSLPDVLCVLQICLEGEISKSSVVSSLSRGKRAAGDLIPWTVTEQFQDHDFASLSGARVVRIATHPDYQGMGYGSRALELLEKYYEGKMTSLDENETPAEEVNIVNEEEVEAMDEVLTPRKSLPPLLWKLSERRPEQLNYIGVSYGLTAPLLKFWSKAGYTSVYLRQTANDLTGEHSCIMLKALDTEVDKSWQDAYFDDFRRRFISLLHFQFSSFKSSTALQVLRRKSKKTTKSNPLTKSELDFFLTSYDTKRLTLYSRNMADYHLVMDLLPTLARLVFLEKLVVPLSVAQKAIILAIGLQHKSVETVASEIDLPSSQVLGLFNRAVRKITTHLSEIESAAAEKELKSTLGDENAADAVNMQPLEESLDSELNAAAYEVVQKQKEELKQTLASMDLKQYEIGGSDEAWQDALSSGKKQNIVSVKSAKRPLPTSEEPDTKDKKKKRKFKKKVKSA